MQKVWGTPFPSRYSPRNGLWDLRNSGTAMISRRVSPIARKALVPCGPPLRGPRGPQGGCTHTLLCPCHGRGSGGCPQEVASRAGTTPCDPWRGPAPSPASSPYLGAFGENLRKRLALPMGTGSGARPDFARGQTPDEAHLPGVPPLKGCVWGLSPGSEGTHSHILQPWGLCPPDVPAVPNPPPRSAGLEAQAGGPRGGAPR